jgi:hypothetical protein
MPKPSAPSPMDWAAVQMAGTGFDINELNRVVRDYAYIELELAARDRRRTPAQRLISKLMTWVAIVGLIVLGVAVAALVGGRASGGVIAFLYVACILGAFSVLYFYLQWRAMPYRQADRTVSAFGIMATIFAVGLIIAILTANMDNSLWWLMMIPAVALVAVSVGTIVGHHRFRSETKPPAVDLDQLSPENEQVLLESRHRALLRLRARRVVSYPDFEAYDQAPLQSVRNGGV